MERRNWKKERKEKWRGLLLDAKWFGFQNDNSHFDFLHFWVIIMISFIFLFFFRFFILFLFCFVCFFWSFHQTVSATPALSSLILRQWNQKNVTKAPQYIIICKKSLFITAVNLSMKVAMEKEKEKKNEKKKKMKPKKRMKEKPAIFITFDSPPSTERNTMGKGTSWDLLEKGTRINGGKKKKKDKAAFFLFFFGRQKGTSQWIDCDCNHHWGRSEKFRFFVIFFSLFYFFLYFFQFFDFLFFSYDVIDFNTCNEQLLFFFGSLDWFLTVTAMKAVVFSVLIWIGLLFSGARQDRKFDPANDGERDAVPFPWKRSEH